MNEEEPSGSAFPDPYSAGMTLRQYAAIHLKVPDSGSDWLDDMIRKSVLYGIIEYDIEETTAGDSSDAK